MSNVINVNLSLFHPLYDDRCDIYRHIDNFMSFHRHPFQNVLFGSLALALVSPPHIFSYMLTLTLSFYSSASSDGLSYVYAIVQNWTLSLYYSSLPCNLFFPLASRSFHLRYFEHATFPSSCASSLHERFEDIQI